ncbi:MAG: hypothetical protein RLZZ227_2474 [Pseudomonadota bacterium]|jgi:DNA-binding response OmpR family regulator
MLEELKEQYRQSLPEKIRTIRALLGEMRDGKTGATDSLRLLAHSLHGSGTTFGYPQISAAAKNVEQADTDSMLHQLTNLLRVLLEAGREANDLYLHILIVEDDADISNLMKVLLTRKSDNYRIKIASSSAEASVSLKQQHYGLVVLDLVLSDGDGRVLLREIRATLGPGIPVFVLSGVDRQSIKDECLALGAQRFFSKPFDPEAITSMIDAELRAPAQPVMPPAQAENTGPASGLRAPGRKVLLAEDDELLAGIIKHRLARDGFEVVHVNSGADAMHAVEYEGWCLIILDVKMPVHDGFEVLARTRALPAGKAVPVIMLTAMGSEKDVVRGYDMGASDYIVKPFSPVELLARVKSLVKP